MAVTRVVIGVSSWRDYSFLAPLTAVIWKDLIGLEPFLMLVGDWTTPERNRVALSALKYLEIEHVPVGTLEGYPEATLAQNCRQHAAVMPFPGDAWLMLSDADLWPINQRFYYKHEAPGRHELALYYSNGDHYQTFPTCHQVARARTWREIMGYKEGDDLRTAVLRNLEPWLKGNAYGFKDPNFAVWMSDQAMATDKIKAWKGFPGLAMQIERPGHPPADRVDRSVWPKALDLKGKTDAHVLRPADQPGNWERVRELFGKLCPKRLEWADHYRERYLRGYDKP